MQATIASYNSKLGDLCVCHLKSPVANDCSAIVIDDSASLNKTYIFVFSFLFLEKIQPS